MKTFNQFVTEMNESNGWAKAMQIYHFSNDVGAKWMFEDKKVKYVLEFENGTFMLSIWKRDSYFFGLISEFYHWKWISLPYWDYKPDLTLAAKAFQDAIEKREKTEHEEILEYLR